MISNSVINNFDICDLNQILPKTAADSMIITQDSIFIFIASIIGLCSMTYGILSRYYYHNKPTGFTLHFVGIRRPNNFSKSQYKLLDNIDTATTMITIQTSLKENSTISDLKDIIKKTYSLPNTNDILIFHLDHIVCFYEESNQFSLKDFGIHNNSLLTLAVCHSHKIDKQNGKYAGIQRQIIPKITQGDASTADPVRSVNQLFDMFEDDDDDDDDDDENTPQVEKKEQPKAFLEPYIGFDVIMQQGGVMVYKMPNCGHEMAKDSLYEYAINTFSNNNNMKLYCPHRNTAHTKCKAEWDLNAVLEVLRACHAPEIIEYEALMKLQLLCSRNNVENADCNVQKCPKCKTLHFKNKSASKMKLDEIKTVQDISNEFKTECVFCPPPIPTIQLRTNENKKSEHDIDMETANKINAMFGMFEDENDDENEQKYAEISEKTNSFCFCCGEEWTSGHICDNSFRRDLIEILEKAPIKKIGKVEGVPSIRCCPVCCQLLFHIECCKHMNCKSCNTRFCMVCMKTKKDGKWQCGSSSSVCPVTQRQNMDSLPHNIVITKQKFRLFDEINK